MSGVFNFQVNVIRFHKICILFSLFFLIVLTGCAGNDTPAPFAISAITGSDYQAAPDAASATLPAGDIFRDAEDEKNYYAVLEKTLNEKSDLSRPSYSVSAAAPVKSPSLSTISLDKATDSIKLAAAGPTAYDLSKIQVTGLWSDGTKKTVYPVWSIYSARGSMSGNIFTPARAAGMAILMARYKDGRVTRYALFRLAIIAPAAISLSKYADKAMTSSAYDLSTLSVTVIYSNGTTKEVSHGPGVSWVLASGRGSLNGTRYKAPLAAETASFKVSFLEAGTVRSARFKLTIVALTSITPEKNTVTVKTAPPAAVSYDLSGVRFTANYSDKTSKELTAKHAVTWTKISGLGTLSGTVYSLPSLPETAVFKAEHADSGVTRSAKFKLNVIAPIAENNK